MNIVADKWLIGKNGIRSNFYIQSVYSKEKSNFDVSHYIIIRDDGFYFSKDGHWEMDCRRYLDENEVDAFNERTSYSNFEEAVKKIEEYNLI